MKISVTGVAKYLGSKVLNIHVVDHVKGHLKVLSALKSKSNILTINLGTGIGRSFLEVVKAFEKISWEKYHLGL